MAEDKILLLTLINPDTNSFYAEDCCTEVSLIGPTSIWIKLDDYPCKSPLRWLCKPVKDLYPQLVETQKLIDQQYPLFKQQRDTSNDEKYGTFDELEKQINQQYPREIEEMIGFIDECIEGWKDFDNALITLGEPLNVVKESYYLTADVTEKLDIDHLEAIEDNYQNGLANLLLKECSTEHLSKDLLLITTPFVDYIGDGLQVVYDQAHHYITDDGYTQSEFETYCNGDSNQKAKVEKYLHNLAKEYRCEYVDHEFRKTTDRELTVHSQYGEYQQHENSLMPLLQCMICAYYDLKHHLYQSRRMDKHD